MNRKKTIILLMVIMVFLSLACWFPPYIQEMSEAPSGDQGSEQIIEETLVFSSKGVSIRLPNSYQLGDIEAGMQALSGLGEYQQLYDKERENIMLWAYESSPSRGQTHLFVIQNNDYAALPLGVISTFANVLLGDAVDSMIQEPLTLGGRSTIRYLTKAQNEGIETGQAVYLLKDSGKLWVIGFLADSATLNDQLSIFNQAVASFSVLSGE